MIHIIFFSKDPKNINIIKQYADICCNEIECTYLSFEYPMDILDYLNNAHPEKCAVFFMTHNLGEGLEIAEKVNEINHAYRFNLFCDTFGDVEKLFYNGVTYYIKTPCESESLKRCSVFMGKYYNEKSKKCIMLKSKTGTEPISLPDVDYILSDRRKITVISGKIEKSFYYKLDEIEQLLGNGFLRCHQSYIVNMNKIKKFVSDGLLLNDDTFIPSSRKRYYASKKEYLSYITGNSGV